ncbi:MAG: MFS transporter [Candidatus Heimdallarchaeota archaeon]
MEDTEFDDLDKRIITPDFELEPRMKPNVPGKLNKGRTILISVGFLAALAALTYYNIAVPILLDDLIDPVFTFLGFMGRNTFIFFLMTIDNILALTMQPIFGRMSDRTESKIGRRMPYLIIGIIGSALFFGIAPWAKILGYFVAMLICYNVLMAFFRSPALDMVADYTQEKDRFKARGIQQWVTNIGSLVAFGVPILIGLGVSKIILTTAERNVRILNIGFPIISAIMLICLLIVFLTIKETPTGHKFMKIGKEKLVIDDVTFEIQESNVELDESFTKKRRKRTKKTRPFSTLNREQSSSMILMFIAIFFWFAGFGAMEASFSLIGTKFFGLDVDVVAAIGLVYPVSMIIAALPTGLIGQKFGRKRTIYLCLGVLIGLMAILGFIVMLVNMKFPVGSVVSFGILMGFVGFFWMGIIVNTFPIIWNICPKNRKGAFTGVFYTFSQLAAVIGPLVVGIFFDLFEFNAGWGDNKFRVLFPFVLICLVLALVFVIFVKGTEAVKEEITKEIEYADSDYKLIDDEHEADLDEFLREDDIDDEILEEEEIDMEPDTYDDEPYEEEPIEEEVLEDEPSEDDLGEAVDEEPISEDSVEDEFSEPEVVVEEPLKDEVEEELEDDVVTIEGFTDEDVRP